MIHTANTSPLPVLCNSLRESARQIPDSYLISCPFEITKILSEVMSNNYGIRNPYVLKTEDDLHIKYKENIVYKYAESCIENFNYIFDMANNMLFEYKERFGYEHQCISATEFVEYNVPNIPESGIEAIPLMCKKTPRCYIVDYSTDKTVSFASWMVWLRDVQKHTLVFTNREIPYYAKKNKLTAEQKEQQAGIVSFWESFISKRVRQ